MRITFLLPADNFTGGTRVVAIYARLLQARGHEVLVVFNPPAALTLREGLRMLRRRRWDLLRHRLWPRPGLIALSGVPHKVLAHARPFTDQDLPDADAVVATWWETAVWMHRLLPAKGAPVHLIQGYEVWGGDAVREQVHQALRMPNLKLVISAALQAEIEQAVGPLPMQVVPNAVDLAQFDAPPRQRHHPPTVGFIYAHSPIKGVDRVFKAVAQARKQVPELRLVAFGAVKPTPDVPLPPGTEFSFRPAQDQLAGLYAACDVWLFPSRQDSFGLPLLEAMACRTPVIGVPVGAAPDLLSPDCGVLLPGQEDEDALCEAMAQAVVRLCQMPDAAWRAMSEAAYQRTRQCNWEGSADRLASLLNGYVHTVPSAPTACAGQPEH